LENVLGAEKALFRLLLLDDLDVFVGPRLSIDAKDSSISMFDRGTGDFLCTREHETMNQKGSKLLFAWFVGTLVV
jgi:hypothetical protein